MKSTRTRILIIGAAVILAVVVAIAQGMHGHGGPGGFEHMLGFYMRRARPEQRAAGADQGIWQKEKPALEPLMQQMKQFHSHERVRPSGTFDEAKIRALATQQSQTMIEMAVQHARIKSEMMQILTPDQKTKLAQIQAKHEPCANAEHMGPRQYAECLPERRVSRLAPCNVSLLPGGDRNPNFRPSPGFLKPEDAMEHADLLYSGLMFAAEGMLSYGPRCC